MEAEKLCLRQQELKKLGLCKHDCGKPKPADRDECYTCRSNIRRQKIKQGPSELDLVKNERDLLKVENNRMRGEIASLRSVRNEEQLHRERLQSEIDVLAQALADKDSLCLERDGLRTRCSTLVIENDALREELHVALGRVAQMREELDVVNKSYRILSESVLSKVVSWNSGTSASFSEVHVSEVSHDLNSSFSSLNLVDEKFSTSPSSARAVKCGVCKRMKPSPLKVGGRPLKNPCIC